MGTWIGQTYLPISLEVDRTVADDPPSYESRGRKPYTPPPGPCQTCEMATRCAAESLACSAFLKFAHNGKLLPPTQPSRAVYERLFSGDDLPDDQLMDEPVRAKAEPKPHAQPTAERLARYMESHPGPILMDAVALALNVSRNTVRDALGKLRKRGHVIDVLPRRRPPTPLTSMTTEARHE